MSNYCRLCGALIEEWDEPAYWAREQLCIPCYERRMRERTLKICSYCGKRIPESQGEYLKGRFLCGECLRAEKKRIAKRTCHVCKRELEDWEKRHFAPDGTMVCDKCFQDRFGRQGTMVCSHCGKELEEGRIRTFNKNMEIVCVDCLKEEERGKRGLIGKI